MTGSFQVPVQSMHSMCLLLLAQTQLPRYATFGSESFAIAEEHEGKCAEYKRDGCHQRRSRSVSQRQVLHVNDFIRAGGGMRTSCRAHRGRSPPMTFRTRLCAACADDEYVS